MLPRDFGGPDQLELVEVDTPEPGEGQVRLAVRAIGVNPIDWYHYDGVHSDDPEDLLTFGYEVAGVVEAVGAGVTGFAVGDEVVASDIPGNGYAEQVVVPASGLLAKPANVSFEVAASVRWRRGRRTTRSRRPTWPKVTSSSRTGPPAASAHCWSSWPSSGEPG